MAILITCHNRKEQTLACLRRVYNQQITLDVYLVDDGSKDGTLDAVANEFPQTIILSGDGNLFWNQGMHKAWALAAKNNYAYYIWLNDDTIIEECALKKMLIYSQKLNDEAIICAAIKDPEKEQFTYGPKDENKISILPNGKLQPGVTFMNGNFVLVPKKVYDVIGNLDPIFHHDIGDFDYGLRALKAGIIIYATPEYMGVCTANDRAVNKVRMPKSDIFGRFKRLYSPLGYNPKLQFAYIKRHWGLLAATIDFIKVHLINIVGDDLFSLYERLKN